MINFSKVQLAVLEDALYTYGFQNQCDILIEEMSELTKAIIKYRRNNTNPATINNMCEEIADVLIMLQQMLFAMPILSSIDVESFVNYKINRLAQRLEEEKSKKVGVVNNGS